MARVCPTSGCENELQDEAFVCADCYFKLPVSYSRLVNRTMIAARREQNPELKEYLNKQSQGYVNIAVKEIEKVKSQ